MKPGSQRDLAKALNCSVSSVNDICKKKPHLIARIGTKIDIDISVERIVGSGFGKKQASSRRASQRKQKQVQPAPTQEKTPKKIIDEPEKFEDLPELTEDTSRPELERIRIYEQTRKDRIANDKADKLTIDRQETENKWFDIARTVRDSLETIPGNVSGLLIGKTKHEIEQILIKEIKRSLLNLKVK